MKKHFIFCFPFFIKVSSIRNNFTATNGATSKHQHRNHEFNYFYKLLSSQFWVIFGGWGSYRIRIHRFQFHAT